MQMWLVWSIVSVLTYGVMSFLMKVSVDRVGWRLACVIGMGLEALLIMGLALSPLRIPSPLPSLTGRGIGIAAAVGVGIMSTMGFASFMLGSAAGQVSLVQAAVSAGTLAVLVVLAGVFLGERLTAMQWGGVVLSVMAIGLLTFGGKGHA